MEKGKKDFYVELVLFLILGILIGVAVKMEAAKRIAIGFDDYKMRIESQDYNINKLKTDLTAKELESQSESDATEDEIIPEEDEGINQDVQQDTQNNQ